MHFYDEENKEQVDEFEYRNRKVRIFRTFRGAVHCKLPHHPEQRRCDNCGAAIEPALCFLGYIENNHMAVGSTAEEATARTKQFIDFAENPNHNGKKDGNKPPDDRDKDKKPPEPEDGPEEDEGGGEDEDDDDGGIPNGNGRRSLPPRLEKIAKLGWPAQLKTLAQKLTPKRVVPTGKK